MHSAGHDCQNDKDAGDEADLRFIRKFSFHFFEQRSISRKVFRSPERPNRRIALCASIREWRFASIRYRLFDFLRIIRK